MQQQISAHQLMNILNTFILKFLEFDYSSSTAFNTPQIFVLFFIAHYLNLINNFKHKFILLFLSFSIYKNQLIFMLIYFIESVNKFK